MAGKLFAQSPHVIPSQILILKNEFYVVSLAVSFVNLPRPMNSPWIF